MKIIYHPEIGELELNRKKGRKNISLQYKYAEGRFTISYPYNCPIKIAIQFANSRIDWMRKTKSKSSNRIVARNLGSINRTYALEKFKNIEYRLTPDERKEVKEFIKTNPSENQIKNKGINTNDIFNLN